MKYARFLTFFVFSVVLAFAAGTSFGQSTDRDNPTPMNSSEVSGVFGDHQQDGNKEIFYSFTAGPGELTITFDIKRRSRDDGMAGVSFELLQRNGSSSAALMCCEGVQTGDSGTGREVATVKLTRREGVILHITNASNGGGIFNVRLSGAATSFGPTSAGGSGRGDDTSYRPQQGSRGDDRIDVPSSGTLRIKMKNGTTQEINLNRVSSVSVRP